ncbi:uncharacterized protein G6M90_00g018290 [Metarhizium brunneum]|uniref:Uncharacterized protein n=1 Tax=Metarhizium brunneum TaxID=500148 RepID=A0A7D5Z4L0_9HYPO|nr:hypothetical protein G6M90_00g018290 [Metarhizium brunneum]
MRVEHKEGMLTTESMRGDLWLFAFSVVCINEATAFGDGHFVPVAASNADAVAGRGPTTASPSSPLLTPALLDLISAPM